MPYFDGFLVPARDRQGYIEMAERCAPIFIEHGALEVMEGFGQDVPRGEVTDFYRALKAEDGETPVFSWIIWPDKATRDAGWEKVMADPRMAPPADMPFDGKRNFWGGFEPVVHRRAGGEVA
ncbi:DUF1428 domain-containing protein [Sphingomonas xinjiangensis]|uniref:Uncharacterized protein YbaA (DUF1428 family) n=1 Tax=Sphingomonas xinjiangensis TaxID=643568 RepID=A0A840YDA8_9SPHN|nr:DUF1428 domain-containing protein [Sphingomonas xinjiangensis]MBB5709989.1 uncharacterized protein YbaA (DUF1428 family) [Sphingomonas xinjiangensis]